MKNHRRQGLCISVGLLPALVGALSAFASLYDNSGPGRLSELISQSDYIVVASCVRTQAIHITIHTLDFAVQKQIKGKLDSFTLQLGSHLSPVFSTATGSHPSLMFLKTGPDGKPDLTSFVSVIPLDARDAGLPSIISRELEINAMPAGPQRDATLQRFILPLLSTGGNSYTEESLAEDLLDLCRNRNVRLSHSELELISRVATNTDAYKVALPLSLVLDQQNSPLAAAACLHVLLDTDESKKDGWYRLAPVLAKREDLRESYVQKIEQTQDSTQVGSMLTQLSAVDPATLNSLYERLWRSNPAARQVIQHVLTHTATPEHGQLLHRLTAETGPPP
jgi:hypothetical protein